MKTYRRNYRRPVPSAKPMPRREQWFIREATATEDARVYPISGCQAHFDIELQQPGVRLFDPSKDSRGPAVRFISTWGGRETVWHPQTEGNYLVAFTDEQRPEPLSRQQLHFGSVSTPQPTKAAIHRLLLDILEKTPALKPFLKVVKMPCVFCKDHPEVPGGSSVDVDIASLPPAAEPSKVAKFYMGF